jgi:N-acetylglucosamine kinase-like BadF-type ATPase
MKPAGFPDTSRQRNGMKHYLGLDAGGTKTFCLIGDETGSIKGFGAAGTGNYEYEGVEPAERENRLAVERALADANLTLGDIAGIGMGIAGADLPEDYEMLEREVYTPLFGETPRAFRNDSMGGLRGGTREPFGIVIACGTGCVCAGINRDGAEGRVGGLGNEFGDECTGTDLGRIGLRTVWQARDGVIPETLMTSKFVKRAGCADIEELFYKVYREEIGEADLHPMAKIVFDAAFEGDPAACDILERGGRYLGAMVNGVARKLGMTQQEFEVVMAGSVLKGSSPVLVDAMRMTVHQECPRARTVMPIFEPVVGTLLLGMELDHDLTEDVYENLSAQLLAAEERYGIRFRAE